MKNRTRLTKRQKQCFDLIVEGFSNAKISEIIKISEHTVKQHNLSIFKALRVDTRSELIVRYYKSKLKNMTIKKDTVNE